MAGSPNDDELVDYDEYDPEEGVNFEREQEDTQAPVPQSDPTDFIRTEQKSISDTKRDRSTSKMKDNKNIKDSGKRSREDSRDSRGRRRDGSRDRSDRHRHTRDRSKDHSRDRGKDRNNSDRGRDKQRDSHHRDAPSYNNSNRYDKSRHNNSNNYNNKGDDTRSKQNGASRHHNEPVAKTSTSDDKQFPINPSTVGDAASATEASSQSAVDTNDAAGFGYGVKNMYYGAPYNPTAYANPGFQPPYPPLPSKPEGADASSKHIDGEGHEAAPSTAFSQPPYPSMGYANYDPSGMYNMPYGYANYGYNYAAAQPPLPPGLPPGYNNQQRNYQNNHHNAHGNHHNNNYRKPKQAPATPQLPEHERCTLLCTGIPHYVTEDDVRAHFESFGYVVELQLSAMETENANKANTSDAADESTEKKKVYNECLIQFYSAQNAKKCFSSPLPVLNNRFIHLKFSKFNIMPPQDVEPPSMEEVERDRALLTQDIVPQSTASQPGGRKKATFNMYTNKGSSNKWRRTDDGKVPGSAEEVKEGGEEHDDSNANQPLPEQAAQPPVDGEEALPSEPAATAATHETPKKEISKEDLELKQSFDQLKSLKQQAEELLKKKEAMLQTQLEKCRGMMAQLEKTPNSDKKTNLQQNLEGKIVDMQAQLRTVREQIEKGLLADKQSPPPKNAVSYFNAGGRFGGRFGTSPRYHGGGGGRGYMGGRGRFGGRGFYAADINQYDLNASQVEPPTSEYQHEPSETM